MGDETRLLPDECARAYGQVRISPSPHMSGAEIFSPEHCAAASLHGWGRDGDPNALGDAHFASWDRLRLSRAEYEAALRAVSDCDQLGNPRPHLPALSPHVHDYAASKAAATTPTAAALPGKDSDQ